MDGLDPLAGGTGAKVGLSGTCGQVARNHACTTAETAVKYVGGHDDRSAVNARELRQPQWPDCTPTRGDVIILGPVAVNKCDDQHQDVDKKLEWNDAKELEVTQT